MPRVKQAAKHAHTTQVAAVTALGAAGLGLSLTGSASAYTIPTADIAQSDDISPNQRFVLGEEEMADVSLATFYLFDKENAGGDMTVSRRCCSPRLRWVPRVPWLPSRARLWWLRRLRRLLRALGAMPLVLNSTS